MPDVDFEAFKDCVRAEAGVELATWEDSLFQPLKDLHEWWGRQSDQTKKLADFLLKRAGPPIERLLQRVTGLASAELAAAFAGALVMVAAVFAFQAFMEIVGRCLVAA